MKKMPTIFIRDDSNRSLVTTEPHPDCGWVFAGEGVATRKYDGTCCLITEDGRFMKRRMVKSGKPDPEGFVLAEEDQITGKRFGWVPVMADAKEDRWHREAFERLCRHTDGNPPVGTYELLGPCVQGNPEQFQKHHLLHHHHQPRVFLSAPRTFDGLKEWFKGKDIEGLVFQHPDGRMAKIKKSDFGMKRED